MSLPVIDTHQHLWDLSKFQLPWLEKDAGSPLQRNFVMSDYLTATQGLNVVKTVYMEVDVAVEQQPAEAEYVLDLIARQDNPMAAAVISGRPASDTFPQSMKPYAGNPLIKGIRQVLHGDGTPPGFCLQPAFVRGIRHLGEIGKTFDLCMRPAELGDAVKLVDQCPQTRFILDHCGNMSVSSKDETARAQWLKQLKELAARANVVCKISGIIVTANPQWTVADLAPNVNDTLDAFGEDRVMFAGDWPVCTLRGSFSQWLSAVQEITKSRSETFRKKLFHDNAVKFYGLA